MNRSPFIVSFYKDYDLLEHIENKYIVFYLVKGAARVFTYEKKYLLKEDTYLILNCNRRYKVNMDRESFLMKIEIDSKMICGLAHKRNVIFDCYSFEKQGTRYEKLRYVINELMGEFAIEPQGLNCQKMSKLYNMCDYMLRLFVAAEETMAEPERINKAEKALSYIEEHYKDKITLNEIAEYMYMAPASFSRFFSKATGITFVSYLIKVRLEHAVEDLLISEDTISDIALKNGFGSASQFNKQFKNSFHMSPSEYKSSVFKSGRKENMEESQQLSDELRKYKSKTRLVIVKEQKIKVQEVEIDTSKGEMLHNPWGRILNLGYTSRLLSAEYQRQIIMLKQQLNFEYGIINGLFSPELKLKDENGDSGLNFVNLDYVLDFLAENNIRPLLILDSQIMSMVKKLNENEKILCLDVFDNSEQCSQTVGRIIDHIIYRYGLREVSGWKFAVWYDTFSKNTLGIKEEFYRVWDDICKEIHTRIPEAEIGGCGLGPSVQERELIKFFTKWKKAEYVPDYLTVNSFPYRESDNPTKMNAVRRNVSEFFIEDILDFKSVLQSVGFWKVPVVVLEWNLSFVQRNYFNDMVGKAALMMKHMVQGINEVESAGYWPASDLQAGDYDAARILNGAGGLISADGICKPTFYALAFFKELQRILVSRGEHYIVTKDDRGNFCIILYNNKNLNHNYYSKPESSIDMLDDNLIFENQDTLEISLTLKEVPDKKYLVRKQVIGAEKGSVLDEWMRLGTETQLNVSDLSYLKSKSVPDRKNEEISSQNHQIVLKESLNAHEILLLQLL